MATSDQAPRANQVRASGETAAVEVAREQVEALFEEPTTPATDDRPKFRTPGFQRMRYTWLPHDAALIAQIHEEAMRVVVHYFADAYSLLNQIFDIVREPMRTPDGEVLKDRYGFTLWQKSEYGGGYVEDWTNLTRKQIGDFIGMIVTQLFGWEMRRDTMWADAMIAKAQFEERFAVAYGESSGKTVDDRTAAGNRDAAEERYYAIYMTYVSRLADSAVRSMERIQMRLKDLLQS